MTVTKTRLILVAVAALAALMLLPGVAYANFAIHGGYLTDTDACAGCHRAHTSISSITWNDSFNNSHSALLVSSASSIYEFCYACHGADVQGADTNVEEGIYEGTLYGANGGTLNGGGFETVAGETWTSKHELEQGWGAYGGGTSGRAVSPSFIPTLAADDGNWISNVNIGKTKDNISMDCATCHDPHGSSNYRILKDMVYGNRVGGYYDDNSGPNASLNPTPTPWVTSVETGYPDGGWLLHNPGAAQVAGYKPNYTRAMYARGKTQTGADVDGAAAANKGMSGWCAGCHAVYNTKASTYNAGDMAMGDPVWADFGGSPTRMRHRHPMNVPLSNYKGARALVITDTAAMPLPLAHDSVSGSDEGSVVANSQSDWIECLTCHRAHGTAVTMTGYADSISNYQPSANTNPGQGVPPANTTVLLRGDNRYVCEICHNK